MYSRDNFLAIEEFPESTLALAEKQQAVGKREISSAMISDLLPRCGQTGEGWRRRFLITSRPIRQAESTRSGFYQSENFEAVVAEGSFIRVLPA